VGYINKKKAVETTFPRGAIYEMNRTIQWSFRNSARVSRASLAYSKVEMSQEHRVIELK
jgi:hypothetical protein